VILREVLEFGEELLLPLKILLDHELALGVGLALGEELMVCE
jgi:hypothetical protein